MGSVVQTWGIASATGAENAPFYLLVLSAGYYYLFSVPTKSSFVFKAEKSLGGAYSPEMYVLGRAESALQVVYTASLFCPCRVVRGLEGVLRGSGGGPPPTTHPRSHSIAWCAKAAGLRMRRWEACRRGAGQ
eukprot:1185696-Prorocentrum_minimum.AAC.4